MLSDRAYYYSLHNLDMSTEDLADQFTNALLRLPDGTEIIGGNAGAISADVMKDLLSKQRHASKDMRRMADRFTETMERLPDVSTPGVEQVTLDEIGKRAGVDARWLYRLTEMAYSTTDFYKDLKAAVQDSMPNESTNAYSVKLLFDSMLDQLHDYDENLLEDSLDYISIIYPKFQLTEEVLEHDYEQDIEDESQLHRTATNVLRQYISNFWNENCAGAQGEILQERAARLALHFREIGDKEKSIAESLLSERDQLFKNLDMFRELSNHSSSQLSKISRKIGVPPGTFEANPPTWYAVGNFAPTFKAWKSAVHQLVSGERTNALDIIKGWGPEGAEYVRSLGYSPKKKNKSSKKRPKNKKKKGSRSGTEETTSVSVLSEDTSQTPSVEVEEEKHEASSAGPTERKKGPAPPKKKGHRRSKFEQMLSAVDKTSLQSTEKAVRSEPEVSADWNTIRTQVQREFAGLRSRLEKANEDTDFFGTLIGDDASTAELKSRVTNKKRIRGRRAGEREAYTFSKAVQQSETADFSQTKPSAEEDLFFDFEISHETWPRLEDSVDRLSPRDEAVPMITIQAPVEMTPQEQFEELLASVKLEECGTEGVEPSLVSMVSRFIPSVERKYGQRGLSVEHMAGVLGGWAKVRSTQNERTRTAR